MKRPLFYGFLYLCLSIFLFARDLPVIFLLFFSLPLIVAPFFLPNVKTRQVVFVLIICLAGMIVSKNTFSQKLDFFYDQEYIFFGKIVTAPEYEENRVQFLIKSDQFSDTRAESVLLVNNYENNFEDFETLNPGDIISFSGELRELQGVRNPGGFDYPLYLKSKEIDGLITYHSDLRVIGHQVGLREKVELFRLSLEAKITQNLKDPVADLLKGILLGDKSIDENIKVNFQEIGISHILAVSGLHVGYITLLIISMFKLMKIRKKYWILVLAPILLLYCALTGFSASVIRASLMFMILFWSEGLHVEKDLLNNLLLAAIIILLIWPAQLFQAGFQLSMGAVLGIILFNKPLHYQLERIVNKNRLIKKPLKQPIIDGIILTTSVLLTTTPIMMAHFGNFYGLSFLSNLLIIPLVGIFVICGFLFLITAFLLPLLTPIMVILISFIGDTMLVSVKALNALSEKLSFLTIKNGNFDVIVLLMLLLTGMLVAGYFNGVLKFAPVFYGILLLSFTLRLILPGYLEVIVLDVGQGDSILIKTPNHNNFIIDGGGYQFEQDNLISDQVLYPAFRSLGVNSLEGAFISHNHADHQQGIEELVADQFDIKQLLLTVKFNNQELLSQETVPITQLKKGTIIENGDGVRIEVLWPDGEIKAVPDDEQNNASLVFLLSYKNVNYLFCGDIEKETETQIIKELNSRFNNLDIQLLKVPHHGSETSSSAEFLEAVDPEMAVISVGQNNMYGHPDQTVLELYLKNDIKIFRTDLNGAIIIKSNGEWIKTKTYLNQGAYNEQ
ncbi:DNA internalization-related competence protein ComEC/Rec2 [Eubacteriaceae bacterium ES2]|nr:DNA internalization-related competence protein ComEC/Rec2 [Eubacteriaceae bacterium ES2]